MTHKNKTQIAIKDHRMAVGMSLKGKIDEFGFFLFHIINTTKIIEIKHLNQDYPLNRELDVLNYYFSAFLNTILSIRDICQISMDIKLPPNRLSPTYGSFIFYCRNATTHDGSHLIQAGQGIKNYIVGPLRRIDGLGRLKEFKPPKEDIHSLCYNLATEVLTSIKQLLKKHGKAIPVPNESDFKKGIAAALECGFIPEHVKAMIKNNRENIDSSFNDVTVNVVKQTYDVIAKIESDLEAAHPHA